MRCGRHRSMLPPTQRIAALPRTRCHAWCCHRVRACACSWCARLLRTHPCRGPQLAAPAVSPRALVLACVGSGVCRVVGHAAAVLVCVEVARAWWCVSPVRWQLLPRASSCGVCERQQRVALLAHMLQARRRKWCVRRTGCSCHCLGMSALLHCCATHACVCLSRLVLSRGNGRAGCATLVAAAAILTHVLFAQAVAQALDDAAGPPYKPLLLRPASAVV
jgi:hypothetical protein